MVLERFYRYWVYFRRGHGVHLALIVALLNFLVIQYRLLIQLVKPLDVLFPSLTIFALAFIPTYAIIATLLGWWDYKRGTVRTEAVVGVEANPYFRDVATALELMAQGRGQEAAEILKRWSK